MYNQFSNKLIFFILSITLFFSCKQTKYLEENEYLLIKNKLEIIDTAENKDDKGYDADDLHDLIRPTPNSRLFGMRINLAVYNFYSPENTKRKEKKKIEKCIKKKNKKYINLAADIRGLKKERDKFKKGTESYIKYDKRLKKKQERKNTSEQEACDSTFWNHRIGEAPVLYKRNKRYRNVSQIRIFLKNRGYYFVKVRSEEPSREDKENKKVTVEYKVFPGKPYRINKIAYSIKDTALATVVYKDSSNSLIKRGTRLDVDLLKDERQRISNNLRNSGYYRFSKEYIYYSIDTLNGNYTANLIINIKQAIDQRSDVSNHKKFLLDEIRIYSNFDPKEALIRKEKYYQEFDTITYIYNDKFKYSFLNRYKQRLRSKAIVRGAYIFEDSIYSLNNVKSTYKYLSGLKIIKIANIGFKEKNRKDTLDEPFDQDVGYLECDIKITQKQLQSFTFELEGTNTSGNIGAAGNILYSHRNIFKNAEVFDLKLKGALERQTNTKDNEAGEGNLSIGFFNSYEYGIDLSIKFPRFLAPYKLKSFIKRYNPQTSVSANFNYMNRPSYSRTIMGLSYGYFWNSSQFLKHIFKPVVLDFVDLENPTQEFIDYIERYHLYDSYKDHFILGIGYSIIYNNQQKRERKNRGSYSYLRINGKASGNTLYGIMKLAKQQQQNGSYHLANNAFSQFFKFDIDYRYYKKIDRAGDKLVFRTFLGVAYPYGNLKVVPFVEQYFSGGANGIRAWQVRALGPGTYSIPINTEVFPNQTADIKIEGNIEYRAKLFWLLEGAVFLDVGNIWAINDQDERRGAQFKFKSFYKELAIGTGIGFRLDFDFFIIRFDFGLKLKDPTQPLVKRWIPTNRRFYRDDWTFNVGIGYPF